MFATSPELARRYAETIVTETDPDHRATQELIRDYVLKNSPARRTASVRGLVPHFSRTGRGRKDSSDCWAHLALSAPVAKRFAIRTATTSPTIPAKATYFEPGVLAAFENKAVRARFETLAEFSDSRRWNPDTQSISPPTQKSRKTLVLIKPDNFKFPNVRPGQRD